MPLTAYSLLAMRDPLGGKALYSVELEPELISGIFQGAWQQRRLVPLTQIPPGFIDAILAAEDHRFYEHHGIDLVRIVKAAWIDFSAGHVRAGRLDADPAVDEELLFDQQARLASQGQRSR